MPLNPIGAALDPADFVVAPHVAILDTFRMTNPDGSFAADITETFIDRLITHMAERELATGDLCPLVIGHTQDGLPETEQPPLVGYARNWHKGTLGSTGRPCAFFDAWILKSQVELAKKFPRRSAEVWASRYEIDPVSLLGATTPARDLGLLKLNREGSFTYSTPSGDSHVPTEPKPADGKPTPDPKETGDSKAKEGTQEQILSLLTQILAAVTGGAGAGAGATAAPPAPGADAAVPGAPAGPEGAPGAGGGQMSDQEYEQLLQELMGEGGDKDSRADEKPTKNGTGQAGYPGGANTVVPNPGPAKMSREDQETAALQTRVRDLEAEVTRGKVRDQLVRLQRPDIANPEDESLVADLVAMHPDARARQLDRIAKTPAAPGAIEAFHLNRALEGAVVGVGGRRKMTQEDATKLSRKASAEGKSFEQVASEAGFDLYA